MKELESKMEDIEKIISEIKLQNNKNKWEENFLNMKLKNYIKKQ